MIIPVTQNVSAHSKAEFGVRGKATARLRGMKDYLFLVFRVVATYAVGFYLIETFATDEYFAAKLCFDEMRNPGFRYVVSSAIFLTIGAAVFLAVCVATHDTLFGVLLDELG